MESDSDDSEPFYTTARRGAEEEDDHVGDTADETWVSWVYHFIRDWIYTNVIGFLVVSYWRVRASYDVKLFVTNQSNPKLTIKHHFF